MIKMGIILLWLTAQVFAQDIPTTGTLADHIITLKEEKYIYHWTEQNKVLERTQERPFSEKAVLAYAQATASYQLEMKNSSGLYFALDPVITASAFGGFPRRKGWVLVALRLPVGTKLIDVSYRTNAPLTEKEQEWFRGENCLDVGNTSRFHQFLSSECTRAFKKYLDHHKISGYVYTYGQIHFSFCTNYQGNNNDGNAVLIKDKSLLTSNNAFIFYSENIFDEPQKNKLGEMINGYFHEDQLFRVNAPFTGLAVPGPIELGEFSRKHLFQCNGIQ